MYIILYIGLTKRLPNKVYELFILFTCIHKAVNGALTKVNGLRLREKKHQPRVSGKSVYYDAWVVFILRTTVNESVKEKEKHVMTATFRG